MKRVLSLALVLIMLLSLVACTPKGSGKFRGTSDIVVSRGEVINNTYTNETLGLKFKAPNTWVYATDEEISSLLGIAVKYFDDDRFQAALDSNVSIYDIVVVDKLTNTNVIVGYENLKMTYSSNMTVEQYIETLKEQLKTVSGMYVTFSDEIEVIKLGENEYTRLVAQTISNGVKMTQVYYLRKIDVYMGFVIVTINGGYSISDIEAMFK